MIVNYNNFSEKFAHSRKWMKWEELNYFFSLFSGDEKIVDIWCGSGRFLEQYDTYFWKFPIEYTGIDLSEKLLQEAGRNFPMHVFLQGNMLDISQYFWAEKKDTFVLIASFHHLDTYIQREDFLESLYNLLPKGWKIYMTNWNLLWEENQEKYKNSFISGSENEFGSKDFSIKFWEFSRFYHAFSLQELERLSKISGFEIQENRIFTGGKNIITILQKSF